MSTPPAAQPQLPSSGSPPLASAKGATSSTVAVPVLAVALQSWARDIHMLWRLPRGHNELRDELAFILSAVDSSAVCFPVLLPAVAPDALSRPAHPTHESAIDIMITATLAGWAGSDLAQDHVLERQHWGIPNTLADFSPVSDIATPQRGCGSAHEV